MHQMEILLWEFIGPRIDRELSIGNLKVTLPAKNFTNYLYLYSEQKCQISVSDICIL